MLIKKMPACFMLYGILLYLMGLLILNIFNSQIGGWSLSELLINYQGGFVRRGLIGEFLFLSDNPIELAHNIQRLVVIVFLGITFALVVLENGLTNKFLLSALAVFASGGFLDLAIGSNFGYLDRKEVWFYCSLGMIFFSSKIFGFYNSKNLLFTSVLSCLMTLHHELYAIYFIPFALLIVLLSGGGYFAKSVVLVAPTFATLVIVASNSGDQIISNLIRESYMLKHNIDVGSAITAIGWKLENSQNLSIKMIERGSLKYWLYHILVNLALLTVYSVLKSNSVKELVVNMIIILITLCATIFAIFVGWDWGRWISMFVFMSIFFIFLSKSALPHMSYFAFDDIFSKEISVKLRLIIVGFVLICTLTTINMNFRMSVCCPKPSHLEFLKSSDFKNLIPFK